MDHIPAPPQTSGKATGSLISGILGLLCIPLIPAIVAVILGHSAKKEIKHSNGTLGGEGLAMGGLITGYIGIFLGLFATVGLVAAIMIPAFASAKNKAQETASIQNVRQLVMASIQYAEENEDTLPTKLSDLDAYFGDGGSPTASPLGDGHSTDYILLMPGQKLSEIQEIATAELIEDQASKDHGYRIVGYADGHVDAIPTDDFFDGEAADFFNDLDALEADDSPGPIRE